MSLFHGFTNGIEKHIVDAAVDHLGKDGETGLHGIGTLKYDYTNNTLSMEADPKILKRVRESWREQHGIK